MNEDRAQSIIVSSLTVTALLVALNQAENGKGVDAVRIGIGWTFSAFSLALLAEAAPKLAAGFAVLIATGAVFSQGAVIAAISKRVAPAA